MKYKNVSGATLHLVGIGDVEPDQVIEVTEEINNQNFELMEEKKPEPKPEVKDEEV